MTSTEKSGPFWPVSLILFLIAVLGFWPSFIAPGIAGRYEPPTAGMIFHIISAFAWMGILIVQPVLVSIRQTGLHRLVGMLGGLIALATVATGLETQIAVLPLRADGTIIDAVITPFFRSTGLLVFGGFIATAIWQRRHTATHKRLMVFGTLFLLEAPINRILINIVGVDPEPAGPVTGVSHLVLALAFVSWDRLSHGRFNRTSLIALLITILLTFGIAPFAESMPWRELVESLGGRTVD
ncbi:hypothetical protein [Maricaulis maris]|uniref:hypothetical protein n=1 Tax=Maricaulis maris TaxID=74318 RepID=UPI003A8F9BF0